jgi:hypothetical protein
VLSSFEVVVRTLQRAQGRWVDELKRSRFGTKDVPEFTAELLHELEQKKSAVVTTRPRESVVFQGTVIKTFQDKNGLWCGFIGRSPDDIFFHSAKNPGLLYHKLEGAFVNYEVCKDERTGRPAAIHVEPAI